MYDRILEKKSELEQIRPSNPDFSAWAAKSDLWCWVYSVMRTSGVRVGKNSVVDMLDGKLLEDFPLSYYAFVSAWKDVASDMRSCIEMNAELDVKMLNRWAGILYGLDDTNPVKNLWRQNNPIVYEWELIPVHFRSINDTLSEILKLSRIGKFSDPLEKAAFVHLEIDRLYPYGENTQGVSFAALLYMIMKEGLPVPELSLSDIEYNKIVSKYCDDSDRSVFTDVLKRCVYNRLDAVLILAKQASEMDET